MTDHPDQTPDQISNPPDIAAPADLERIAYERSAFARTLGARVVAASASRIEQEMVVTPGLLNRNGMLHGGAIMALADCGGGTASFIRLAPGEGTVTVESKTNFFRAVAAGETVRAVTEALHVGRRTHVWQTSLLRADGKLAAQVTQTQIVLRDGAR